MAETGEEQEVAGDAEDMGTGKAAAKLMIKMTDSASGKQNSEIWALLEQRPAVPMLAVFSGILLLTAALIALDLIGLAPWLGSLDKRGFSFRQFFS